MTDYEDIGAWLDKPFRKYTNALPERPIPCSGMLKDKFFEQKLADILALNDDVLCARARYISGLGKVGEKALFRLISSLDDMGPLSGPL